MALALTCDTTNVMHATYLTRGENNFFKNKNKTNILLK